MKKLSKEKTILILIIGLAFFLRLVNLSHNPAGLHDDEADTGYNAFSILKTERDWYGEFLPLQFKGYAGNYRNPLYTYMAVPSLAVFGLNSFAMRFPAAIFGVATVFLTFVLAKKLIRNKKIFTLSLLVLFIACLVLINNEFFARKTKRIERFNALGLQSAKFLADRERRLTVLPLGFLNSLLHNKAQVVLEQFRNNYFNAFSINYWFVNGEGNLDKSVVDRGEFYIFELLTIIPGIYLLFKLKEKNVYRRREEFS